MKKLGIILLIVLVVTLAGCSQQEAAADPEVKWETLAPEEQSIEVTVTDIAKRNMEADWGEKSSNTSLFMLIPGSS